jgi:ribosome-interacting GTPase 1
LTVGNQFGGVPVRRIAPSLFTEVGVKIQFERHPQSICAVLTEPGECDRIINVDRASDAIDVFALDVSPAAYKPLDALFALSRVVCVEIEQREGGWRVEAAYWNKGLGTLAQYETDAATLSEALARCVWALAR